MASNTTLNIGAGGDVIATKERSHDGDPTKVQVVTLAGVTGTEGAYTFGDINGDAANGLDVDVTRLPALVAGTANIGDVDVLTLPAVAGGAASDAPITGNPVPIAGRASTAVPTDMSADGDVVVPWLTRKGALNVSLKDLAGDSVMDEANNSVKVTLTSGGVAGAIDDTAVTLGTVEALPIAFVADETATDFVDEGDAGMARMTLDRKQIMTDYVHAIAGGSSSYSFLSTAAVQAAVIKASAGKVFSLQFFNANAAARYVRLYDQSGSPGTGDAANILWRGMIPGNTAATGFVAQFPKGKQFTAGIGIRVTAAVADNDNTALAANEIMGNVDYA